MLSEQQVTMYAHNDYHNDWIMIPEHGTEIPSPDDITEPLKWVKNGDIIRLLHPVTKSYLYSKKMKAPVTDSEYHFEVRCVTYASEYNST
jgi:dolichyl-phosphate-mannose-protein mannosyltransferase